MNIPDNENILRNPNMCIGDSVDICDVDFRKSLMTNTEAPE